MVIVREHQESSNKSLKQKRLSLAFKKRKANIGDVTIQHIVNHESINFRRMYQYVWRLLQLQRRNPYNQCICNAPYFPKVLSVLTNKNQTQL